MSAADKIAEANGPERIWAHGNCMGRLGRPLLPGVSSHWATWETRTGDPNHATEYVRADLADAQAQEIERLMAENERLRNLDNMGRLNLSFSPTHQHKKRGSAYEFLGTARIQSDEPLSDMAAVEVYIGRNGDLWARRQSEFHDGRFTVIGDAQ